MSFAASTLKWAATAVKLGSDSSVLFTLPAASVEPKAVPGTMTAVIDGSHAPGAVEVVVRNDTGDGMTGSVPPGSVVDLDGTSYTVTAGAFKLNKLTLSLPAPGLTAALVDGAPVSFQSGTFAVSNTVRLALDSFPAEDVPQDLSFGFEMAAADIALPPASGWLCTLTPKKGPGLQTSGVVRRVFEVHTIIRVWVGK